MDIVLPTNAVPFQERFNDFVGGVALDCNFVVFTDINACDYYEPEPEPTPTVTASPTETPTPTPTLTPTPTDPRACRTYTIASTSFSTTTFNWTNCDGTPGTKLESFFSFSDICAKQGSVSSNNPPFSTITDIGTCP
jgi:hypothetical protein